MGINPMEDPYLPPGLPMSSSEREAYQTGPLALDAKPTPKDDHLDSLKAVVATFVTIGMPIAAKWLTSFLRDRLLKNQK